MNKSWLQYKKTISILLGVGATWAMPPHYQVWILFICFGWLMNMLTKATSAKQVFALGYWFGFGFFAIGFSWVANALAIDIKSFWWLIPIALSASGAFFGIFVAVPALVSYFFRGIWAKIIVFSVLWGLGEWLRSFLLTGFPWNLLGSALAFDYRLLQWASILGTYGLSVIVMLIVTIPVAAIKGSKTNILIATLVEIVLLSGIIGFGLYRTNALDNNELSDLKIRLVQPSIPQSMKWDFGELEHNFADYIEMSQSAGFETIDAVIWGETASTFPLALDRTHFYQVLPAVPDDGFLITGSIDYYPADDDRWLPINAGLVLRHGKGIVDSYAKSHLVPFGEYIPFRKFIPAKLRPITKVIADFRAGHGVKTIHTDKLPPFGILICYEIIFPHQVANAKDRPQWLINLTNDGWYGKSSGPYQHLVTAQLRAVEEGLTVVRAANSGISALISRNGKILASIALHKRGILDIVLPKQLDVGTLYSQYGNLIFGIMAALLLVLAVYFSRLQKS